MESEERIKEQIEGLRSIIKTAPNETLEQMCKGFEIFRSDSKAMNDLWKEIEWELLNRKSKEGITKETFKAEPMSEMIKKALEHDNDIDKQTADLIAKQRQKARETLASTKAKDDTMEM